MPKRAPARRIALCLGLLGALAAGSSHAADTGNGSKNFRTPTSVPNYFSNEAGPLLGPTSETRRGPLYSSDAPALPAQPASRVTAQAPRARQHIAMAEPRGRLVRGRSGLRLYVRHVAVHGHTVYHPAAHGSSRARAVHGVSKARFVGGVHHTAGKARHTSIVHHHGRG